MTGVAFIDTETTGLEADYHEIWEVAAIIDGDEYEWFLPVDLSRADLYALKIGHFHERYDSALTATTAEFAEQFGRLTIDRHLVGAVPSFDEERLRLLLRDNGACPGWHYHLIDVEALAVGYLCGRRDQGYLPIGLPWKSDDLSRMCKVEPPSELERHTALGDARWAKRLYEAICGA